MSDWEPRVWVGCMACYNDGKLIGAWYDPAETNLSSLTPLHVHTRHALELANLPDDWEMHEELWVYDSEGFEGFHDGEGQPADFQATYDAVERALEETGSHVEALRAFVDSDHSVMEGDDLAETFQESFCGTWRNLADYAESLVDEGQFGEIPDAIASYIDYDKIANDFDAEGYWVAPHPWAGTFFVFRPY